MTAIRRARDLSLLDAIDSLPRQKFSGSVWRVCIEGRDPLTGSPSRSRWCDGGFDVLYTAQERDGAIAEIHAFLSMQPVFPSKPKWRVHCIEASAAAALTFVDLSALSPLGVDAARYPDRDYTRTQVVADAAEFLGFDAIVAPSARWRCQNVTLFTNRIPPDALTLVETEADQVDWAAWRRRARR